MYSIAAEYNFAECRVELNAGLEFSDVVYGVYSKCRNKIFECGHIGTACVLLSPVVISSK